MQTLKAEILKAQKAGDIASLYMMEQQAHDTLDETTLGAYYKNILDLALERLGEALAAPRKMQMQDVQDVATLRALYEYAIEHYSAGKNSDASALFEVLSGISNDEAFGSAMKVHQHWADTIPDFETFIESIADLESTQRAGTFYISAFKS